MSFAFVVVQLRPTFLYRIRRVFVSVAMDQILGVTLIRSLARSTKCCSYAGNKKIVCGNFQKEDCRKLYLWKSQDGYGVFSIQFILNKKDPTINL